MGLLGLIPILGGIIGFVAWIAAIVSGVLALRESAEFDTGKAVITMIISGLVAFIETARPRRPRVFIGGRPLLCTPRPARVQCPIP